MIIKRKNKITVSGFDAYFQLINLSNGEILVSFWDIRKLHRNASDDIKNYYINTFLSETERLQYISELKVPAEHDTTWNNDEYLIEQSNLYLDLLAKITGKSKSVLCALTKATIYEGIKYAEVTE